jgi:hypothetical protein
LNYIKKGMGNKINRKILVIIVSIFFMAGVYVAYESKLDSGIDNVWQITKEQDDRDSFEGRISHIWWLETIGKDYSVSISNVYHKDGNSSLRVELRKDDPIVNGGKRSEISLKKHEPRLEDHVYSFSIYLPDGGAEDFINDTDGSDILAQWHNTPDRGEEWTYPPVALRVKDGHWYIDRYWDDAKMSTDAEIDRKGNRELIDLGSYIEDKGKWVDWRFHIKWGWNKEQKPVFEVYKNGILVCKRNGLPNTMNDEIGVCMKLGIYKWGWILPESENISITNSRVVYYDCFVVE